MPELRATNAGPFPGTDPAEACSILLGELGSPHLPTLPELAERGVGADPVGRSAAMLAELPVEMTSYGWRLCDKPGQDARRAHSWLKGDVNALADVVGQQNLSVPELRLRIVGPMSLATGLHLPGGERAISDAGAVREIAASQRDGLATWISALREAVPGVALQLLIREPMAARAQAGAIPTVSGYRTLRAVERSRVRSHWAELASHAQTLGMEQVQLAAGLDQLPTALQAKLTGLQIPGERLDGSAWEHIAQAQEDGLAFTLGLATEESVAEAARRLWRGVRDVGLGSAALQGLTLTEAAPAPSVAAARAALTFLTGTTAALTELANS